MLSLKTIPETLNALRLRIREERVRKGWSQQELALRAGVKMPTYTLFERTGQISLERLAALCEALGRLNDLDLIAGHQPLPSISALQQRKTPQRGRTLTRPPANR